MNPHDLLVWNRLVAARANYWMEELPTHLYLKAIRANADWIERMLCLAGKTLIAADFKMWKDSDATLLEMIPGIYPAIYTLTVAKPKGKKRKAA